MTGSTSENKETEQDDVTESDQIIIKEEETEQMQTQDQEHEQEHEQENPDPNDTANDCEGEDENEDENEDDGAEGHTNNGGNVKDEENKQIGDIASPQPSPAGGSSSVTTTPSRVPRGAQQIPIQPYAYPPYPYYPPVPGYAPPHVPVHPVPTAAPGTTSDGYMTGVSNPYQYTDVSNCGDPAPDTRRNRGGVTEPFPEKLHRMLESAEREGMADVVSFFSHGRAFAIHKPRRFVQEIMPRFFRQTRLTSFQRQLNLYGFRRISQGPDNGGYYHELFLKGRSGLCVNMKRTKVKGTAKLKRDPDSEPNFYSYPPIKCPPSSVPAPGGQVVPHSHMAPTHASGSPPRPPTSPPSAAPYPAYTYAPPHYAYPPVPNAPYTAAQQGSAGAAPVYPYPPYYGYPWYPPPHHPGQMAPAPHPMTPQASPIKAGTDLSRQNEIGDVTSTPVAPTSNASEGDTPASADSVLGATNSVLV